MATMLRRVHACAQKGVSESVEGKTKVEIRFNKIAGGLGGNHAYLYAEGPKGQRWAIRAGPEQNLLAGNVKDIKKGIFGNLTAQAGQRVLDFDGKKAPSSTQFVGYFDSFQNDVVGPLQEYGGIINAANIPYSPTNANSNAFVFSAAEILTGERLESNVNALGSGVDPLFYADKESECCISQ